jgi:hypothetical protein
MRQGPGFANNFARSRIFSSRATISRRVLTRPRRGAFVLTIVPKLVDKIQDSFDANRATEAVATRLNFVICRLSEQIFRVDKWSACQG